MRIPKPSLLSSKPEHIGKAFIRLGWIGFWLQAVLAALPIVTLIYVLLMAPSASTQRMRFDLLDYIGLLGLVVLLFTLCWFYRYTRLGARMADPAHRPSKSSVIRTIWIGLGAGCLGVVLSMILIIVEVARLFQVFLNAPQGGLPVVQTATEDASTFVAASDMASLLAELSVVNAELIVIGCSLWLLLRMTVPANAYEGPSSATTPLDIDSGV